MLKNKVASNYILLIFRFVALIICILSVFVFKTEWFSDSYLLEFTPQYSQYEHLWVDTYGIYFERGKYAFSICSIAILGLFLSGWKSYKDSKMYGMISYCVSLVLMIGNYVFFLILTRYSIKCWGGWAKLCFVSIGVLTITLVLNVVYYIKMRSEIDFGVVLKNALSVVIVCVMFTACIILTYIRTYEDNKKDIRVRYSMLRELYLNEANSSFFGRNYNAEYFSAHSDETGYFEDMETNSVELYIVTKFVSYYDDVEGEYNHIEIEDAVRNLCTNSGDWGLIEDFYESYKYICDNVINGDSFDTYYASTEFAFTNFERDEKGAYTFLENVYKRLYELGYEEYENIDYDILEQACIYVYDTFLTGELEEISLENPLMLTGEKVGTGYKFFCPKTAEYLVCNVTTTDTYIKVELLSKVGYDFNDNEEKYDVNIEGIDCSEILIDETVDERYANNHYIKIFITP